MGFVDLSLLELVEALRPDWRRPEHLGGWARDVEGALKGGAREMCAVPIQHYKSSTTLVGIVWLLLRRPALRIILLTHSFDKAQAMSKDLHDLIEAAGMTFKKRHNTIQDWETEQGGRCVVMSAEQSRLGYPCDILLVDDPLDEDSARDKMRRDAVDAKIAHYTARAATHLNSVLIVASRWGVDDVIGRRLGSKAVTWGYQHGQGIIDFGLETARAYAPDVLSLEGHMKMRAEWQEREPSLRTWWAQVQNDPQPEDQGGFGPAHRYARLPEFGSYWTFGGVDVAYSLGVHADNFAYVVLRTYPDEGRTYLLECHREKRDLDQAHAKMLAAQRRWNFSTWHSYVSGPEKGALLYLEDRGIHVEALNARYDKGTRARATQDSWNAGKILVPEDCDPGFLLRLQIFTGDPKAGDDDEIDALVSAHDGGMRGGWTPKAFGKPRL